MTDAEIEALLAAPESDRVERKAALSGSAKKTICEAICAFANDYPDHRKPGIVIVGQHNDGRCAGTPITESLLHDLEQLKLSGQIVPMPSMTVQRRTIADCDVAVLVVEPSAAPPVRFDGRTWIRTGSSCTIASVEDEGRLAEKRRWKNLPFDAQPMPHVGVDELDREYFRSTYLPGAISADTLAANHRDLDGQLLGLRMLDPSGAPTVLGVLVLGIDPQRWVPGAYIQFLRFDGTELTDSIRDRKEATGRVAEVIRRVEEILEVHATNTIRFADVERAERRADYPLPALRQLVRNAVMHRAYDNTNAPIRVHWFDDRIEIHNPGGPFGQVTQANFGTGVTDYRNPNLASALHDLGFVERFGLGIPQARAHLERNGNPPLEWETSGQQTLLRVRRAA